MKKLPCLILLLIFATPPVVAQDSKIDSLLISLDNAKNDYAVERELYRQLLPLLLQENDSSRWLEYSYQYAYNLLVTGNLEESIKEFKKIDSLPSIYPLKRSNVKTQIGFAYRYLQQYEEALRYYDEALKLAKEANDTTELARLDVNMGVVYQRQGDLAKAFEHLNNALETYEALGDETGIANASNAIFLNLMRLRMFKEAEPFIKRNLEIRIRGNHEIYQLDIAYHNLAWFYQMQDRLDSAIIYYNKSLNLTRQIGNKYEIATTLQQIGSLYSSVGDFDAAKEFLNEAMQINEEINRHENIAEILMEMANIAEEEKNFEAVDRFLMRAYSIYENSPNADKKINFLIRLAQFEVERNNIARAHKLIEEAEEIALRDDLVRYQIRINNLKGELYLKEGHLSKSKEAFEYVRRHGYIPDFRIKAMKNLARIYRQMNSDSAYIFADEAFALIDELRSRVSGLAFRSGIFREHSDFYGEVASWHIENGNTDKAFLLIEKANARVLTEELAKAREGSSLSLSTSDLLIKQQKIQRINQLYDVFEQETNPEERRKLQARFREAELDYQAFLNIINLQNDNYKNFVTPDAATVAQAHDYLDEASAIVEFTFADSRLISFYITENEVLASVRDSVGGETAFDYFSAQVNHLLASVEQMEAVEDIQAASSSLYNILLEDFLEPRPELENLLFVAQGPLSFLPFEVLYSKSHYLIESHTIKYMPSVSIIPFIKEPHRVKEGLFALAGSGLAESGVGHQFVSRNSNYSSLPSAMFEVEAISRYFTAPKIYKNNEFREADLKTQPLDEFRFLHFATHGKLDAANPSQSGLLINFAENSDAGTDGFLNNLEISMLNLNSDLVVLSACKTGRGEIVSGEGLLGLQRSFLTAGSSGVVVSLWDIYDRSTSVFMDSFYRNMFYFQDEEYGFINKTLQWMNLYEHPLFDYKAKALRQAKVEMISHPYYSHPVYWAAFILIGK